MKRNKLTRFAVIMCMIISMLVMNLPSTLAITFAEAAETTYEIYPVPQQIEYKTGDYALSTDVNVVFESTIDAPTKKLLNEVLTSKGCNVTVSNEKVQGKSNILVGTYNSKGYVDTYVSTNYTVDASFFEQLDSHIVVSNNGEICILGKNTDASYYGIVSLKHILNQISDLTLRNFEIRDFADTPLRGFIEGYYGIPWTNQDRMSLMEFGGNFKMTSYVFAPKNDQYHTSKWRDLYPQAELEKIREMVQVGVDSKCKFVWTAHPFMGGFKANDYQNEVIKLIAKFEQLYSVGVRQFGILGDDVGSLDKTVVIYMMNELSKWGKEKGDVYDWVFCPAGYNAGWADGQREELNAYDQGFPENVHIFWTGNSVCAPIIQNTLDNFKNYKLPEGKEPRRSPLFWLNWPVNDINMGRLMMGKGSLLHTDITIEDLAGVITNPMQDAEPSKVALFAVADYAWNVKDFNDDKSWEDSFKYIDMDAPDELYTLAKHMSNPEPNGHGLVLAESEEIQPLVNEFKDTFTNGRNIEEVGTRLIAQMDIISEACDTFLTTSQNERMVEQMTPFANALNDLAKAIKNYTSAAIELQKGNMEDAFNDFLRATTNYSNSQKHQRPKINGTQSAMPGSTHLRPLAEVIRDGISDEINSVISDNGEDVAVKASASFNNFFNGTRIENIVDKDVNTAAWSGDTEAVGQYFQVTLAEPTSIYGVHILNGTAQKNQNTFGSAKLQYTLNGTDWIDLNNNIYSNYQAEVTVKNIAIDNVTAVRYIATAVGSGNKTPAMREFKLDFNQGQAAPTFTKTVIRTTDGWSLASGAEANLIDGDENTSIGYNVRQNGTPANTTIQGDYVGVELSEAITLGKVTILQGVNDTTNDYFKNVKLQYSLDGSTWTDSKTFTNTRKIEFDFSDQNVKAKYVRLYNNANQNNWIGFREFDVQSKVFFNGKVFTNAANYKNVAANYLKETAIMQPTNNISLAKGEFIGLKLDRIHELGSIELEKSVNTVTLQTSMNNYEWETVTPETIATKNARYIRVINNTNGTVTFNVTKFVVNTTELQPKSLFGKSYGAVQNPLNLFDKDRTTQAVFQGSQTKGAYVTYDLGQVIDLDTFKAVCRDSEIDYPRHGKFSVSTDGQTWTSIMELGNQDGENPGESTNSDEIGYVLPDHEISYNAKKVTNLGVKARYLKFEITRAKVGSDKWVRFQEFELNDGAYLPEVNDPTYSGTTSETENGFYGNMVDKNLTTMFIPKDANAKVNYAISSENTKNAIKIIQDGDIVSNATVKARVYNEDKTSTWKTLGSLSSTINDFILPAGTIVLDIEISWTSVIPHIIELNRTYSNEDPSNPTVPVSSVTVDQSSLKIKKGNTQQLSAVVAPENATNKKIYWSSSNTDIATVSSTGVVTAVDTGTVTIKATADNKFSSCVVKVTPLPLDPEELPIDEMTATTGSFQNGQEALKALDGIESTIWHSNWSGGDRDKQYITVNLGGQYDVTGYLYKPRTEGPNGIITKYEIHTSLDGTTFNKVSEGTWADNNQTKKISFVKTKAKYVKLVSIESRGNFSSASEVRVLGDVDSNVPEVIEVASIKLNSNSEALKVGETKGISAAIAPENATNKTITWSSANEKIATVSNKGVITAVAQGTTVITATAVNGVKATCNITVAKIEEDPTIAAKKELKAEIDRGKTYKEVSYTSDSFAVLKKAIADGEKVYNDATANLKEIEDATRDITTAIANLETKPQPQIKNGWVKESKGMRYYVNNLPKANVWVKTSTGKWNYAGKDAYMAKEWTKVGAVWYYLGKDGIMRTGWQKVSGTWYLLANSGSMLTGWQKVGNTWYLLATSGKMLTGWQKVGNTWYLLDTSGKMLTGWQKVGNTWYLLANNGKMLTGWQKVGKTWYYLASSGKMTTGWLKLKGTWYYLKANGAMATGWTYVNGKQYYLNTSSGAWNGQVR